MIVIAISEGGLGNQMFQYAFYRYLKHEKKNVKIDIRATWNEKGLIHNGYELNRVFSLRFDAVNAKERKTFFRKKIFNLWGEKKCYFCKNMEEAISFDKKYFYMEDKYIYGYFQSEKYFKPIENMIREEYSFSMKPDKKNGNLMKTIKESTNPVSIHIRRGDYLLIDNTQNICTIKYYEKAINIIKNKLDNPTFYVFSDDISWCKKYLNISNAIYVDHNKGIDSYKDMWLMSLCKHNIIANSTFSWWGAYLNKYNKKLVIAPSKWMNDVKDTRDIIPENWIKLNGV